MGLGLGLGGGGERDLLVVLARGEEVLSGCCYTAYTIPHSFSFVKQVLTFNCVQTN